MGLRSVISMLTTKEDKQTSYEFVCIEQLVPENHLLRKIHKHINFSFITDLVRPYYCEDNGRPSIDPVMLFKMLFIGYLFGIRSERQLEREIQTNIAYRWFLGLNLTDKVPHHSTISWNRHKRFKGTEVFQNLFDEIVELAIKHKMVGGRALMTDSTHLKANANKKKFSKEVIQSSVRDYIEELDKAVDEDRKSKGKKSLAKKKDVIEEKEVKISKTDPDSGYMYRENKPEGFFYLDHRTTDLKHNIITDTYITPGNYHDSIPYLSRLDRQMQRFNFDVEAVALDSGYLTTPICKGLEDRNIFGVIAHRRFNSTKGLMRKSEFKYIDEQDAYICPNGQSLRYTTTDRNGYRHFKSDPEICKNCPLLEKCTKSKKHQKTITRHIWESSKEKVRENRLTKSGKILYKKRSQTIERSFADAKELHGLRYCRFRGLENVQEQVLLTAAAQNIKKIANHLAKLG